MKENSRKKLSVHTDTFRFVGCCVVIAALLGVVALFAADCVKAKLWKDRLFGGAFAAIGVFCLFRLDYSLLRSYRTKVSFHADGIGCTLGGKPLKTLRWEDVREAVCVEYRFVGSSERYLLFSGHELSEEEKAKPVKLAAEPNDVVVIKYRKRIAKRIEEIHGFTHQDESGKSTHS